MIDIVCIHGAGESAAVWAPQTGALSDCRAINLPGHGGAPGSGRSSIAGYAEVVADEIEAPAILAGHSMGGAIALQLALSRPELVAGLILIGTGARLRVDPRIFQLVDEDFDSAVDLLGAWSTGAKAEHEAEVLKEALCQSGRDVLRDDLTACDRFDVMEQLDRARAPSLVMVGEEDRMTPPKYAQYLHAHLAGSRLEIVPDAGHLVMLEQPKAVTEAMGSFRSSLDRD